MARPVISQARTMNCLPGCKNCFRTPDQRRKFGEAGRKHSERFDWDPITRRWEEVFLDLMSRKTAARAA